MAKIGDTVRFLNDVGGGVIVRLDGRMAYVRDPHDGFETPMPLSECIIVPSAAPVAEVFDAPEEKPLERMPEKADDTLTAVLLFEPQDIRRLSQTAFDLYLVNDSNYRLLYCMAARDKDDAQFSVLSSGEAEPNVQAFLGEVAQADLNSLGVISVQFVAFKPDKDFTLQQPVAAEIKMDLTRLAKLHCFTSTAYSTTPVLTIPIIKGGKLPEKEISTFDKPAVAYDKPVEKPKQSKSSKPSTEPMVVDLHAHELLDSTAGLKPAEILDLQLREFERAMTDAAKRPGSKVIFIHGKGEGVLRNAILHRLRQRWPHCEAQDASFVEYGFGATQVTIRK